MPTVGTGKNKKTFDYTIDGMKQAEKYAMKTNQRVNIDRSVYGPTNSNPNMNPDSNTLLSRERNNKPYQKKPRPYKVNRNLT